MTLSRGPALNLFTSLGRAAPAVVVSLALALAAQAQQPIAPQRLGYAVALNNGSYCGPPQVFIGQPGAVCGVIACEATRVGRLNSGIPDYSVTAYFISASLRTAMCALYDNQGQFISNAGADQQLRCPQGYTLGSQDLCYPNGMPIDDKNRGRSCNSAGTNPINVGTGNKYQEAVDWTGAESSPLKFVRYYNSSPEGFVGAYPALSKPPQAGKNWSHSYSATIILNSVPDVTTAIAYRREGHARYFNLQGGNTWTSTPEVQEQLARILDTNGVVQGWQLTRCEDASVEFYDADGKLSRIAHSDGQVTELTYSDTGTPTSIAPFSGLLIKVADSQGRALDLEYAADGTFSTLIAPGAGAYEYDHDGFGNLIRVTAPDGGVRDYLYEDAAWPSALTAIIDENADRSSPTYRTDAATVRYATFAYDALGRAVLSKHAGDAGQRSIVYNSNGSSTVTDPFGTARTFGFSTVEGLVKTSAISQPCNACSGGLEAESVVDSKANVTESVDFKGNKTCFEYDPVSNFEVTKIEGLNQSESCAQALLSSSLPPAARKSRREWHATWKLPKRVAEPLRITSFTYHGEVGVSCAGAGAPTTLVCSKSIQATTDSDGALGFAAPLDGAPRSWTYTYNSAGKITEQDGPRTDVQARLTFNYHPSDDPAGRWRAGDLANRVSALGHTTQFVEYDDSGRLTKSIDPNGLETTVEYWPRGWIKSQTVGKPPAEYETTTFEYFPTGHLKRTIRPDGSSVSYAYDGGQRLTEIRDGLGNLIKYTLDAMDNRILEQAWDITGALVRVHGKEFDSLNRLYRDIGGSNPAAQVTTYSYDLNGNVTGVVDPLTRTTVNVYDGRNRLIEVRDPLNGATNPTKYEFDGRDQLTKVTDPSGLSTLYTYDGHGNLTNQLSPDTGSTAFTYDAASNLKHKADARGVETNWEYDALNRVQQISYVGYPDETTTFIYDCTGNLGRLCSFSDRSGSTVYSYDAHGRVATKTQTVAGIVKTIAYGYNVHGQMSRITLPSGRHVDFSYSNNRTSKVEVAGQKVLEGVFYEPFGPIGGWVWGNSTPTTLNTHTRVYDKDFRPQRITSDLPAAGSQPIFDRQVVWDAQGRVEQIVDLASSAMSATYGYDALDRLTSALQGISTWEYTYGPTGDRVLSKVNGVPRTYTYVPQTHRLASISGDVSKTYTYDPSGNMISDGLGWTYGGAGRPISMGTANVWTNALGQRVKKSSPESSSLYVYDESGKVWGEYDAEGNVVAETIWLEDLPIAVIK